MRYWAAARAAAGTGSEQVTASTLRQLIELVEAGHGPRMRDVLARCSFVVDEQPVGTRDPESLALADGAVVEVLPPFAGG